MPAERHVSPIRPVHLGTPDSELDALAADAAAVRGDAGRALELAGRLGSLVPRPGTGETGRLWGLLASLGAADLSAARVAEAHLDALSILTQAADAGFEIPDLTGRTWGVFAAEGPGVRVDAHVTGSGFELIGTKPWCSLVGRLDAALVTAHTDGGRRLFAVDLRHPTVDVATGSWHSRGLVEVESGPVTFAGTAAVPVGGDGWYLERPGFAWGGIGVAACWYGGAVGVARALLRAAETREPDQLATMHLGMVDAALVTARLALEDAARAVDDGRVVGEEGARTALRVRRVVASVAEQVMATVGHALGPAPLALDDDHARRVADLAVYIRQEHAERDAVALGRSVLTAERAGAAQW